MSCNRNTPVCLHQKWTETGRRDCFDCCPEQQNCSITPPSTFIMLFPGISRTQSELNLSWPVAVSQTSTDSHACIELLWETQRGSGGLVARETPMNFPEMTHRALFSKNILFVPHNTMLFFAHCPFFLYWFIPKEKKDVLTWTQYEGFLQLFYGKLFVFTFKSVYKHTHNTSKIWFLMIKYDMKISFSKNSAAEEAWFSTAAVHETHFKPKCLFIFVEHKSWNFWRIICLLTTVHHCDYTWNASKVFKNYYFCSLTARDRYAV